MRKLIGAIILLAGLSVSIFGCSSLISSIKRSTFFMVTEVVVLGVMNSDKDELNSLANEFIGRNIFDDNIPLMLKTEDQWIQKISASRVLPNKINIMIYEEKELFKYRVASNCYSYTANGYSLESECDSVTYKSNKVLANGVANSFKDILANNESLRSKNIVLNDFQFRIYEGNKIILGSYDKSIFEKNYNIYNNTIKQRYKSIAYVNLSIADRVYVKGVRNGSSKG